MGSDDAASDLRIEEVASPEPEVVAALERLLPQLSSASPPGAGELAELVSSESTRLLIATLARPDGGRELIGTLSLVLYAIPTGRRAVIEDVVVDASARGRGVGAALVREAIRMAAEGGARNVDLTSRPSREAANRLYRSLGFEERETNVYRYRVRGAEIEEGAPG